MDNLETKPQSTGQGKTIMMIIVGVLVVFYIAWRWYEGYKIEQTMKKVRQAKEDKRTLENVGENV